MTQATTSAARIQLRGICQCCGRQQAVTGGRMAKHGYTVEQGWFSGVCSGARFAPMQTSRAQADAIIAAVLAECVDLLAQAARLTAGKATPMQAKSGKRIQVEVKGTWGPRKEWRDEMVPYADAPAHYQAEAVRGAIYAAEARARDGERFAKSLGEVADTYHGQALEEVAIAEGPAPIRAGERRTATGSAGTFVLVCKRVEGARVWYVSEGETRAYWKGVQAWRKLPLAA